MLEETIYPLSEDYHYSNEIEYSYDEKGNEYMSKFIYATCPILGSLLNPIFKVRSVAIGKRVLLKILEREAWSSRCDYRISDAVQALAEFRASKQLIRQMVSFEIIDGGTVYGDKMDSAIARWLVDLEFALVSHIIEMEKIRDEHT